MLLTASRTLRSWFRPAIDALFGRNLPFAYRWRLLLLQPISLITYSIATIPWLFSRPFKAEYITVAPGRTLRILVFNQYGPNKEGKLRPLHLDIHGGAFVGGLPEANAQFCARVAEQTGAVVFSTSYRYAPAHPFPAAIDDVDAVLAYLRKHAIEKYGADPNLITVSGDSAGGNLALATALSAPGAVKASVTFYASINLRLSPWQKPYGMPGTTKRLKDPFSFLLPLFDSYPGPVRDRELNNPRMSPYLAKLDDLPENMLLVVPAVDILVYEQLSFAKRLTEEMGESEDYAGRSVGTLYVEKGFHGYLGVPSPPGPKELKDQAWNAGVKFIQDAHRKHGWFWS
ncbi:Alpha/Beta hydrolase protein [Echria macrotheca]|uniref:Alpha/Beta hydrolase protein n=1 Tax=Echria macrotheca TaxID=438768 RepID=A0AAJ0B4C0_9PEZI|nr:Alpha/Beta hydrolase protein [Echria macrotheca]